MARGWGVLWDLWKGGQYAHEEKPFWIGQVVMLAASPVGAANTSRIRSAQIHGSWAGRARCNIHNRSLAALKEGNSKRERQTFSGKTFVQEDTRWWCQDWQQRKVARTPHFQSHNSRKALLLNNGYKPAWLDAQLAATLGTQMDRSAFAIPPWTLPPLNPADHLGSPGFEKPMTPKTVKELCQQGQIKGAIEVVEALVEMDWGIDKHVLSSILKECMAKKNLMLGRHVHAIAVKTGLGSDTFLCNQLLRMYAGHGSLQEAMDVFRGVALPDAFTWSAIISAHTKQGQAQQAIELYQHMRATRTKPDGYVLVAALQACTAAGDLHFGKQVHDDVSMNGLEHDMFVCSSLVDMYAKCGSLKDARRVFDRLGSKDVVAWNAMIAGYAQQEGMGREALSLHCAMRNQGMVAPNAVTFVCLLQACANVGVSALEEGKQLHAQVMERRLESDVVVGGSLVNMYVKCGSVKDARSVFDALVDKNVVTWTAMIAGYAQQEGLGQEALSLYSAMLNKGMAVPNAVTHVCLLQACASVGASALEKGKQLHSQLIEQGLECDVAVGGSVVNMYVKCGSLEDARAVFDGLVQKNVVTWNAMIAGYAHQEGMCQEALSLFSAMLSEGTAVPDAVTYVCVLLACANMGVSVLEKGKQLHLQLRDRRLESDVVVGGSLVNMYVSCGGLQDARVVFDGLSQKNVVTWNAMIAGYAEQEAMGQEAFSLYDAMRNEGMSAPNAVTYMCLLQACAGAGALQQGKQLHSEICEGGLESDVLLGTCLIKMYAKCGRLEVARDVFDKLAVKDVVTWNALLKGYAEHGEGDKAILCFEELLKHGVQPNDVTYICLFKACSHAGLVDQAQQYFEAMGERHGVEPTDQHYSCMVDLLGRSGHLHKAEEMLQASGLAGDAVNWRTLLSACKHYGDPELGRRCFDHMMRLEPVDSTAYLLLASIYANAGRWDEVDRVERLRLAAGARKMPGKACIEVKQEVHEFTVGEERSDVAATLRKMNKRLKEGGHVPQTQLVLRALSEQAKQDALCGHAEKLALAYGLLNTPGGSTLLVTKNLRMCNDCHSSTKIMSRLERREIVVRDGHKVHRFENGACSCQDRP